MRRTRFLLTGLVLPPPQETQEKVTIYVASGLLPRCGLSLMTIPEQENHQEFFVRNP